ncbi:MAG: hypothetical protein COA78_09105 [Blastopirellula sp.]|nr:MAG: hypothetical protein COA78_09105 [Blastopirellula sp.]
MPHTSRDKLNSFHLFTGIGIAAVFAAIGGSWFLFIFIAAAFIGTSLATGGIRLPKDKDR